MGAILAVLLTVGCVVLLLAVDALRDGSDAVTRSETRLFTASRAQRLSVDMETAVRGYFLTGDTAFLEPARRAQRELPPVIATLRRLSAEDAVQGPRAARIDADARAFAAFIRDQTAAGPDRPRAELAAATAEGKRRLDALRAEYEGYIADERAAAARRNDQAGSEANRAAVIGAIGFVLLLVAIPLALLYLMRVVVAPVREVTRAAERRASGEHGARAPVAGAGEVGQLARSFNTMADALEVSRDELEQRGIRLGETNKQLRAALADLERSKQQAILELSTPVLQLSDGLLVLPIIGALDLERAHQIDTRLLEAVRERRARVAVIDVTGVPEIDSRVAGQLLRTVTAVRLLGARVITTGVSASWRRRSSRSTWTSPRSSPTPTSSAASSRLRRPRRATKRRELLLERLDGREQVAVLGDAREHVGRGEGERARVARLGRPRPPPSAAASRRSALARAQRVDARPSSCARRSGSSRRTPCPRAAPCASRETTSSGCGARAAARRAREGLGLVVGRGRVERHVDLHALRARRLREAPRARGASNSSRSRSATREHSTIVAGGAGVEVEGERSSGGSASAPSPATCAARGRRGWRARPASAGRRRGRSRSCGRRCGSGSARCCTQSGAVRRAVLLVEELRLDAVRVALERQRRGRAGAAAAPGAIRV